MRTNELKCLYYAAILFVMTGSDDGDIGSNMNTYVLYFEQDGIRYHILSEEYKTVEVVGSSEHNSLDDGSVVIPQTVAINGSTYAVTTIRDWAFYGCSALASVDMPSVTTIGYNAFKQCDALTSVSMPVATTIGNGAFQGCDALTSVSMPSATTIGDGAFQNCSALTSVSMPSVTTIGEYAFQNCSALTSVSMPSVTTIGDLAFNYCSALTSVDIPASVRLIGDYAFEWSSGLTSVYCHWKFPLECYPQFEETVLTDAVLYVPTGTKEAYAKTPPWSGFINIEEKDYSGISATPQSGLSVKVVDGAIVIDGGDGTASAPMVEVYSASGQCAYRGTDTAISGLPHGVYVVRVGGTVQKVAF